MPPADYSLFCRVAGKALPPETVARMRRCYTGLFDRQTFKYDTIDATLSSYRKLADTALQARDGGLARQLEVNDIQDMRRSLQNMLRFLWPLIGNVVPHSLLRLSDPEDDIQNLSLEVITSECQGVLLEKALYVLLVLRKLNGYEVPGWTTGSMQSAVQMLYPTSGALCRKFDLYQQGRYLDALKIKVRSKEFLAKTFNHTLNIYSIVYARMSREHLYRELKDLYKIDRMSLNFLDWGSIAGYIMRFPADHRPTSIFVSILMTDPVVARRFPLKVGLAVGSGRVNRQIFSLASDVLKVKRARSIHTFLRRFLSIQQPCRDLVFTYLSDKSVADRLYSVFHPQSQNHTRSDIGLARDERQVSETRIAIIRFILQHAGSERDYFLKQLAEENSVFRGFYFKDIYGLGRTHLNKAELQFGLEMSLLETFDIGLTGKQLKQAVFRHHLSQVMAEHLVAFAIFDSDFSLESVLSNNLRHGVIEPRILNAIDLACRTSEDYEVTAELKNQVAVAIQRYMGEWLTIHRNGQTFARLREDVSKRLNKILSMDGRLELGALADAVLDEVSKGARYVADAAQTAFSNQLMPEIRGVLERLFSANDVKVALRERLTESLNAAFADVRAWIGISDVGSSIEEFSLRDLAEFELKLIQPQRSTSVASDVKFTLTAGRRVSSGYQNDIRMLGIYFEAVVTILHNLIANAVKYSGLGPRTHVQVTYRVEGELLTIRVENDLAEMSEAQREQLWVRATEYARRDHRKGTFGEGGTGFKKIRRICIRDFTNCHINIPPIVRTHRFVVEVSFPQTA